MFLFYVTSLGLQYYTYPLHLSEVTLAKKKTDSVPQGKKKQIQLSRLHLVFERLGGTILFS